jgi:hypothetical protein
MGGLHPKNSISARFASDFSLIGRVYRLALKILKCMGDEIGEVERLTRDTQADSLLSG